VKLAEDAVISPIGRVRLRWHREFVALVAEALLHLNPEGASIDELDFAFAVFSLRL